MEKQGNSMKIAVVGGDIRCLRLMDLLDNKGFRDILPHIVAVADKRQDAPGIKRAKDKGLFVTSDYSDFFDRKDIDVIIELTGDPAIHDQILRRKKEGVRFIAYSISILLCEIARVTAQDQEKGKKLREAQTMCDVIMNDLIREDVIVISKDYKIMDINDSMLQRIGIGLEEAAGRYCYEITHHQNVPCSGNEHPCPLQQAIKTKMPSQATHIHLDKDGNPIHYSITCYPLYEGGDVIGAIEISRDISKDIHFQKTMVQQEKLASIGRLSAGVAHEINNPLTTILTSAMLIQEDFDPEDPIYEELDTISKETLRCRKIVQSLLDFARQTKPSKKKSDINEIIMESVLLTKKQAAFDDIGVETSLSGGIPSVHVDYGQIQQAVINLVQNAIEATDAGGKITIATAFHPEDDMIEISINDTGVGISDEHICNVFDPFFTTKDTGTGLGLALTHGIVEQHGGTIEANCKLEKGCTFTIKLPAGTGDRKDGQAN